MSIKGIDNSQLLAQMKAMAHAAGIEPAAQGGINTGNVSNPGKIKQTKKNIARILTILNQGEVKDK